MERETMVGNTEIKYSENEMDSSEIVIENIYVAPTERRKGKARKMINDIIMYARDNGYKTIGLYAEPQEGNISETDLISFYKSCGFESDGDCDNLMTYYI